MIKLSIKVLNNHISWSLIYMSFTLCLSRIRDSLVLPARQKEHQNISSPWFTANQIRPITSTVCVEESPLYRVSNQVPQSTAYCITGSVR